MTFLVYGDSLTTGSLFIGLYPGFRSFASITTWELASSHQMIVYISPGNKNAKKKQLWQQQVHQLSKPRI
jgi:hypothetical protein